MIIAFQLGSIICVGVKGQRFIEKADMVVLATGMVPNSADGPAIRALEDAKIKVETSESEGQRADAAKQIEELRILRGGGRRQASSVLGLRIGGLPAGVDGSDPVTAFLYNLEGQPVWRGTHTGGEDWVFWDGKNRQGEYVQTGLYVLKVSWGGSHTVRTLALVR